MGLALLNFGNNDIGDIDAEGMDALDLHPCEGKEVNERAYRFWQFDMITQPLERDLHRLGGGKNNLELAEKPLIVVGEKADVRDTGQDHCQAI